MGHFSRIFPTSLLLALPIATSLGGCTEPNPDYVEPTPPCASGERYLAERVEFAASKKVDILVVVEKTEEMGATQAALGASLAGLVDRLKADASLDWQLGVTSGDTTDGGALYAGRAGVDGCPDTLPTLITSATADAGATAACLAQVGTEGSPFSRPLESARLTLVAPANASSGLVRADARLVILFVGLHDDCSAPSGVLTADPNSCVWAADQLIPTADYVATFRQAKRFAGSPVSIISLSGPADGAGTAFAGNRLTAVADAAAVAGRSFSANICASNFDETVDRLFNEAIGSAPDSTCLRFAPVVTLQSIYPLTAVAGGLQAGSDPIETLGFWFDSGADSSCTTSRIELDESGHPTASAAYELRYCSNAAGGQ
jgi:hypothetical protein